MFWRLLGTVCPHGCMRSIGGLAVFRLGRLFCIS
ncbi:hypothetical protein SLEP1_g36371 [Rubroshorea leprosula]|uniref:Uncharacterized protein n=1 Tax=Rubroshorea leprosula TaxID=152421 RepID=A0AAV5KRA8_9ROSI|nr:hypothetical protein SLEP1_g36371 [Rubroshorea leprosula]